MSGSRRLRALAFGAVAILCAIASASIASGYRDEVDQQLGELVRVAVTTNPLEAGERLGAKQLARATEVREIPARFAPPDAIRVSRELAGRRPAAPIPVGSVLVASQFPVESGGAGRTVPGNLRAVDLTVAGAAALGEVGAGSRVDLLVAGEPNAGGRASVRVVARNVRLLELEPAPEAVGEGPAWIATVAVPPELVVELVEAENYAREVRVIPR